MVLMYRLETYDTYTFNIKEDDHVSYDHIANGTPSL